MLELRQTQSSNASRQFSEPRIHAGCSGISACKSRRCSVSLVLVPLPWLASGRCVRESARASPTARDGQPAPKRAPAVGRPPAPLPLTCNGCSRPLTAFGRHGARVLARGCTPLRGLRPPADGREPPKRSSKRGFRHQVRINCIPSNALRWLEWAEGR